MAITKTPRLSRAARKLLIATMLDRFLPPPPRPVAIRAT